MEEDSENGGIDHECKVGTCTSTLCEGDSAEYRVDCALFGPKQRYPRIRIVQHGFPLGDAVQCKAKDLESSIAEENSCAPSADDVLRQVEKLDWVECKLAESDGNQKEAVNAHVSNEAAT